MTATVRGTRRTREVDVTGFADQVTQALRAFAVDESYAVLMARAAVVITRKRDVWQARKMLRDAETVAHTECGTTEAFTCHAVSACGTGDCKFATGALAQLTVAATTGTHRRPQYPHQSYSLDRAVSALADQRGSNV